MIPKGFKPESYLVIVALTENQGVGGSNPPLGTKIKSRYRGCHINHVVTPY